MTLEKEIHKTNHKIAEHSELHPVVHVFQRENHPFKIYKEMIEIGLDEKQARRWAARYEKRFYKPFMGFYKEHKNKYQKNIQLKSGG